MILSVLEPIRGSGRHALGRALVPAAWSAIAIALSLTGLPARAQVPAPTATPGRVLKEVGIDQKLGSQVPLDLVFRDSNGDEVALKEYFGKKPVVLALVYYRCTMLCPMTLDGMLAAFKPLALDIGTDYEVLTVSFDPRETPQIAAVKKRSLVSQYGRDGAAAGWHFLTGDEAAIRPLAAACGFRYLYDPNTDQYAHASGIMVLTPDGRLSRYFYGLEYSAKDLRLGLVEASGNKIGSLVDQILLLCYHYDPTTGKYGFAIMSSLRIAGILTLAALGAFILLAVRRERRARRAAAAAGEAGGSPADTGADRHAMETNQQTP